MAGDGDVYVCGGRCTRPGERETHRNLMAPFKGASGDSFCRNSALLEFPNLHVNECGVTFQSPWDGREDERR